MRQGSNGPESGQAFTADLVNAGNFWSLVEKGDGCWLWQGRKGPFGYGHFTVAKLRTGPVHAHRVAYVLAHGAIPARRCVLHTCDNPPCVNPAHLRLGTHRDNMRDASAKKRTRYQKPRVCHHCGDTVIGQCTPCHDRMVAVHRQRVIAAVRAESRNVFFDFYHAHIAPNMPTTFAELVARSDMRRATVVARFFGLYGYAPAFGENIAADFGITRERVRQLRNHTLARLGISQDTIRNLPLHNAWKSDSLNESSAA